MTISKDLLLAILSMDSYNREYGAGLELSGSTIGTATFNDHAASGVTAAEYSAWQSASFYAAAYSTQYGTVISYRGTDQALPSWQNWTLGDVANGWPAALPC